MTTTYVDNPDTTGSASETAADQDESAGTVTSDANLVGKYYKIDVPDFTGAGATGGTALESYLRLGAVNIDTDGGEDLAELVAQDDTALHTAGGVRDHTDANRVVTTGGDKIEVIGGQYRLLVQGSRPASSSDSGDPVWVEQDDEDLAAYVENVYAGTYYELISTITLPSDASATSYAEPPRSTTALSIGDLYEYTNGVDLTEIYAASGNIVEKNYASNGFLELMSTARAGSLAWETTNYGASTASTPPTLGAGALFDYAFAGDLTEVMMASDLLVDKMYGARLLEVISTRHIGDQTHTTSIYASTDETTTAEPWEPDPGSLAAGDLREYVTGNNVQEIARAEQSFTEIFEAVSGDLVSTLQAGGSLNETLSGHKISESYDAKTSIEDTTNAKDKSGLVYLKENQTELTFCPTITGVTASALAGDVKIAGIKAEASVALLHAEISAAIKKVETSIGFNLEIKNLQLKLVLNEAKTGLTLKNYAGVVLSGL